jgi:hypothetical protein
MFAFFSLKKEEERLAKGWSYEPCSFYEKNEAGKALEKAHAMKHRVKVQKKHPVVNEPIPT